MIAIASAIVFAAITITVAIRPSESDQQARHRAAIGVAAFAGIFIGIFLRVAGFDL